MTNLLSVPPLTLGRRNARFARVGAALVALLVLVSAASSAVAQPWTFNGHAYQLTSAAMDWQAAQAEAVASGGHLIVIGSQAEQDFVMNTILPAAGLSSRPVWIGLTDQAVEAWPRWVNAEPLRFTRWAFDAPDTDTGGSKDYVALNWRHAVASGNTPGTWSDVPLAGTTGGGGTSDGPYFGIIEIGAADPGTATVTTWTGGDGTWSTAAKWTGGVPNSAAADAYIDSQPGTNSVVSHTTTSVQKMGRLRIDAGDELALSLGASGIEIAESAFTGSGELRVDGTLRVVGSEANNGSSHGISGNKVISGTGKLQLGGPGRRPEIYNVTVNHATIEGSGQFGRAANTSFYHPIYNHGLIHANVPGEALTFHTKNSLNTDTFKAANGGKLRFATGDLDNAQGQIIADGAGSIAEFSGLSTVNGGTLHALNGGLLRIAGNAIWSDVTIFGPTSLAATLDLRGTITNNGTITIPNGARAEISSGQSAVTLQGTGEIVLDAPADTIPELIDQGNSSFPSVQYSFNDLTVRGRGNVGYVSSGGSIDNVTVLNRGRFIADRPNELLHIDVRNFDNQSGGVLRAENGGILRLGISQALTNEGGTIEALSGGRVDASVARVLGGTVRNVGGSIPLDGMRLVNPGTGMRLEGLLTLGASNDSQEAWLVGDIQNFGTLRIAAGGTHSARLRISEAAMPNVSLTGGGDIALGDPLTTNALSAIFEDTTGASTVRTLTNVDNTLHGFGLIGDNSVKRLALNNTGTVTADVSGKTLAISLASADNTGGTFRATNGGVLQLRAASGVDNVGGVFEALNDGSFSISAATELTGGLFRNAGGTFDLGNATLVNPGSGLTLQGAHVIGNSKTTRLVGSTITNEGSLRARSSGGTTSLLVGRAGAPNVSLIGGGEIILGDPALGSDLPRLDEGVDNATLSLDAQALRGFGSVGKDRQLNLVNNTSIAADVSGKTLALNTKSLTNAPGKTMQATNGGHLYLGSSALTNTGASILAGIGSTVTLAQFGPVAGGLIGSEVGGMINAAEGVTVNGGAAIANAGTTVLGAASSSASTRSFAGLANGGSTFNNTGTIRKINSNEYHLQTTLNHSGAIIAEGGTLRIFGGGTIGDASFSAASGTTLSLQSNSYALSGSNAMTGAGNHWALSSTLSFTDAATQLNASNLNLQNATLTGPGSVNVSGGLKVQTGTLSLSGTQLTQLAGAVGSATGPGTWTLSNAARFVNHGTFALNSSSVTNTFNGSADTLFLNGDSGVLVGNSRAEVRMPFANEGLVKVDNQFVEFFNGARFSSAEGQTSTSAAALVFSSPLQLHGANVFSGIGRTFVKGTSVQFAEPGASVQAARFAFQGVSTLSGAGNFDVANELTLDTTGARLTVSETQLRLGADSLSTIDASSTGRLTLNNSALLQNDGILRLYNQPTLETIDGTGSLRVGLAGSVRFFQAATLDLPLDLAGTFQMDGGWIATAKRGGLLNRTTKLIPNHASAEFRFTGIEPFRVRGQANEFVGSGYVRFLDANLIFEDDDANTSADNPSIASSAIVAFEGATNVSGPGTLSTNDFVFKGSELTVDGTTLQTNGPRTSLWNSTTGGKLTLKNGARILNGAPLQIVTKVGSGLANDPGITGDSGTLFHNLAGGRVIHDTNTLTEFGIDFHNEGVLEFRKGTVNFLKKFTGQGGIAASSGAKVTLDCSLSPLGQIPSLLETTGAGSQIDIQLPGGQNIALNINLNGGKMVAAGGLNMVAAGGMNMVAAGGGNMVAAGGMNMVAAGGGNIRATGLNSLINTNNMVAAGGGNIISHNGGVMVAAGGMNAEGSVTADGGTIRTQGSAGMVAAGAGNILSHNGGVMVAAGGGNIISHNGGVMVAAGGGNVRVEGGGRMVAAGGGNIISHNGGVMVAAGGGNMVAAGGMNINGGTLAGVASRFAAVNGERSNIAAAGVSADTATPERDALMAYYDALNTDPNIGMITVEAGGSAAAQNGSTIVADAGGILTGAGTFSGPGLIKSGGAVMPGSSAGTLTWTGNLTFESGSLLDVEIGGTTPGTQHDVLSVSGTCALNGSLNVRFIGGFGASIQPSDTFDIVTAGSAIGTALAGSRVAVSGTTGSFEVLLVNDGKTLRLANFDPGAVTFSSWASRYGLSGANAGWNADPNGNGIPNLLEYALGLDPTAVGGSRGTTSGNVTVGGKKYQSLSYTRPTGQDAPSDITYTPQRGTNLAAADWSSSAVDLVTHSIAPGPGNLETVTVRSTHPMAETPREFLRLSVTLTAP
jgi:hypothetical protein